MYNKKDNKDNLKVFTVRLDEQAQSCLQYLKEKKMLNKTAIIRLGIAELYSQERAREVK